MIEAPKTYLRPLQAGLGLLFIIQLLGLMLLVNSRVSFPTLILLNGLAVAAAAALLVYSHTAVQAELTRQRQVETSLRESEEKFRILADNTPGIIYLCENDFHFDMVYLNDAVETITGYPKEAFLNKQLSFRDLYHPDDSATILPESKDELSRSGMYQLTYRIKHRSGQWRWVEDIGGGVFDKDGSLRLLAGAISDITQRKQAEQALHDSNERFRSLFDNSPDAIMLLDPHDPDIDWPIIDCNEVACRINGYEREEMIGQSIDLLHSRLTPAAERTDYLERLRQAGKITFETEHQRKDGTIFPVETATSIIRLSDHEIVLGIDRDITRRKEAARALQEANDLLENRVTERTVELAQTNQALLKEISERRQAEAQIQLYSQELEKKNRELSRLDVLKDEFLANTSHELRTPLNGIIGLAASMADGTVGRLNEEQKHNLLMIVSSGRRLATQVNNLLDFTKIKHHELRLQTRPVDIHTLTNVVLTIVNPLVIRRQVKLTNKIPAGIPLVLADENRIYQIMHNLIGNAIKFTPAGQITISAQVRDNNTLAIAVADTGVGIPADKFETIFHSFEQVDASDTRGYGGTGLGLSITRQLVELHGGQIKLESMPGSGSTFTFTLPLYTGPLDENQGYEQNGLVEFPEFQIDLDIAIPRLTEPADHTILIVDDEPINIQVLVNYLTAEKYAIRHAFNGEQALEILEESKPDLVLLDIMMPRISGYEVCQKIRRRYPAYEIPVIFLTAKHQVEDLMAGFNAGANDYLTKPFDKSELLARVNTHLRLAKINLAYSRFIPNQILGFLNKESFVDVQLGDQSQQEMTVLFSDIRNFTSLSANMTPKENFDFINNLWRGFGPVIRQNKGFIDKYIGDSIMALFPVSADDALHAALAMHQQLAAFNQQRGQLNQPPIRVGIGLHTGSLMLGIIGEMERLEATVISDAVNTASRLEDLTKRYQANILISENTLNQLSNPHRYQYRFVDAVQVKGKEEKLSIFEVLGQSG